MSEKIQITQEDIDNGVKGNPFNCAIAVGLKQEFAYEIDVTSWIHIGKDYYRAMPEVIRWFSDFDMGKPVKPITIELVQAYVPKIYHPKPRGRYPVQVCGIARVVDSQS